MEQAFIAKWVRVEHGDNDFTKVTTSRGDVLRFHIKPDLEDEGWAEPVPVSGSPDAPDVFQYYMVKNSTNGKYHEFKDCSALQGCSIIKMRLARDPLPDQKCKKCLKRWLQEDVNEKK